MIIIIKIRTTEMQTMLYGKIMDGSYVVILIVVPIVVFALRSKIMDTVHLKERLEALVMGRRYRSVPAILSPKLKPEKLVPSGSHIL